MRSVTCSWEGACPSALDDDGAGSGWPGRGRVELGGHRESWMYIDMLDFAQRVKINRLKPFWTPNLMGFPPKHIYC